jgi:hypothetical protein
MLSIASTCPSSALTPRDLRDDATCTTRSRASTSLEIRLGNPSPTCFKVKQAARSRCVSHADVPPSILWRNRQTEAHLVLSPKPWNRHGDFEAEITKPVLSVLRPKEGNSSTLVLRLNQETRAPHLHVHGVDRRQRHPTSRSPDHQVHDLCLTIPGPLHHISHDPHRCSPCHTCHLHTTRQVNVILHTNKYNSIDPHKCPEFEFKPQHANDSSQSNQGTDHLVSHNPKPITLPRVNRHKHQHVRSMPLLYDPILLVYPQFRSSTLPDTWLSPSHVVMV